MTNNSITWVIFGIEHFIRSRNSKAHWHTSFKLQGREVSPGWYLDFSISSDLEIPKHTDILHLNCGGGDVTLITILSDHDPIFKLSNNLKMENKSNCLNRITPKYLNQFLFAYTPMALWIQINSNGILNIGQVVFHGSGDWLMFLRRVLVNNIILK